MMIRYSDQGFTDVSAEADFYSRLNETIAWCDTKGSVADPKESLRQLRKYVGGSDLQSPESRVWSIAHYRSYNLRKHTNYVKNDLPPKRSNGGRFLAYFPNLDLCDGVASAETDGFLDEYNIPPYDTWIDFGEPNPKSRHPGGRFLVSWVPHEFVELANGGVEVNPEECIIWLDEYDHPIVGELRKRRLIS